VETILHEDGSFDRSVTYHTEHIEREALTHMYRLPAGPGWHVSEQVQLGSDPREKRYIYHAEGTFRTLASDYAKRDSQTPQQWSQNAVAVRVTSDGYAYEETFSDTANAQELRRLWEATVPLLVTNVLGHLRETLLRHESDFVIATIQQGLITSGLGYLDQVWHHLETIELPAEANTTDALMTDAQAFFVSQLDRWWQTEGHFYPPEDARTLIAEALDQLPQTILEDLPAFNDEQLARYGGAYRDWKHRFTVTVTMPAPITDSNAHRIDGTTATWEFEPLFFLLKPYRLTAIASHGEGS